MRIKKTNIRKIFNSRAEESLEIEIIDASGRASRALVPSGASTGEREVAVFPFVRARNSFAKIEKTIKGKSFSSIKSFDSFLAKLDATPKKELVGGNVALGLSIAFARGLSFERKLEVWEVLRKEFFVREKGRHAPFIFSNLINGGAHGHNNLDIQEYMIAVRTNGGMLKAVEDLILFYKNLGKYFFQKGFEPLAIGDEAGYDVNLRNNFEPLAILSRKIKEAGLKNYFFLALDAAATSFYNDGRYVFQGKPLSSHDLQKVYMSYFAKVKSLISIEDPFAENDRAGFANFMRAVKNKWIVGDDLTTTDPDSIRESARGSLINAVIIKPNQIGAVSETCYAIQAAKESKCKIILSHRSGEVEDHFIIHAARASNADGVKIGAPQRERMARFNELLRIY